MIAWERLVTYFVSNLVLLTALVFIYGQILRKFSSSSLRNRSVLNGILFGGIAVLGMNIPLELPPSVVLDSRNVIVLSATIFGGPLTGLIAMAIVSAFRFSLGGVGIVAGIASPMTAFAIGAAFHVIYRIAPQNIRWPHTLTLSLLVCASSLTWMFSLPGTLDPMSILETSALPVLLAYPLATVLLGVYLRQEHMHLQLLQRLRTSEERFRDFANASSDWFWETDEYRRFTNISLGNRKLPGVNPESYIGKTRESIATDYTDNEKWQTLLQDIAHHKPFQDFTYEIARDNGERVFISINGVPVFDESGTYIGYRGTGSDITEAVKAQSDLLDAKNQNERFLDVAEAIIVGIDKNAIVTLINRRGCDVLGYSEDEIVGQNWFETTIPFGERREVHEVFTKLMSGEVKCPQYFENSVITKEGALLTVTWHNTVQRDKLGNIIGTLSSGQDITARKVAEEEMQAAIKTAETASRAKTDFLSAMSHELRTPLNAIQGFAQVLAYDEKHPLTPEQRQNVEHILSGSEHLSQLVNGILDLTAIEAEQYSLDLEDISANDLVRECIEHCAPLGKAHNVRILDTFSPTPPVTLNTDAMRFKQVLNNLLSNAIKFNKAGGTVTVDADLDSPGYLRVRVTDTGIGIPPQDLAKVFGVFHRGGTDPMISHEGTGIGLTVSKLLVERMAGEIGCTSMLNQGSTFWIKIPLSTNHDVLIWTDQLRVGVDAIDKDHQILVSLLNKVITATDDNVALAANIGELIAYLMHHFRTEEEIMRICFFPDTDNHIMAHDALVDQLTVLNNRWKETLNPNDLYTLRDMLHVQLMKHLVEVDGEIVPYTIGREHDIQQALQSVRMYA